MKKILPLIVLLCLVFTVSAQQKKTDSLVSVLKKLSNNEAQLIVLKQLVTNNIKQHTIVIPYAKQGLTLARKLNKPGYEISFLDALQNGYYLSYNFSKQLEVCLAGLDLSRKLKNDSAVCTFYNGIVKCYKSDNEPRKAINYGLTGLKVAERINYDFMTATFLNNISRRYKELGLLDSALYYIQKSNKIFLAIHSPNIAFTFVNMAEISELKGDSTLALSYYRQSIAPYRKLENQTDLGYAYVKMAKILFNRGPRDSVLRYATFCYNIGRKYNDLRDILEGALLTSKWHEGKNDRESLRYYKIAATAKDSLNNTETAKQLQIASIKEQEKQAELAEQKQKQQEEEKENLQMIAIALFIPIFLIAVLLLSRTRTHRGLIDFMGVLSLLLLFEFITLLIHPQVEKITHHTPVLELLILVALAAILVPMHHNLTHWLKGKLGGVHLSKAVTEKDI